MSASYFSDEGLDARRDELRSTLPIGRVVGPEDVAALAVHLMINTALTGAAYYDHMSNAAIGNGELTVEELKEMAIFLTHYLGFPLGSKLDGVVSKVAKQRKKGGGEDKKANVNAAVQMHSGGKVHDDK